MKVILRQKYLCYQRKTLTAKIYIYLAILSDECHTSYVKLILVIKCQVIPIYMDACKKINLLNTR